MNENIPLGGQNNSEKELSPAEFRLVEAKEKLDALYREKIALNSYAGSTTAEQIQALDERIEEAKQAVKEAEEALQKGRTEQNKA